MEASLRLETSAIKALQVLICKVIPLDHDRAEVVYFSVKIMHYNFNKRRVVILPKTKENIFIILLQAN